MIDYKNLIQNVSKSSLNEESFKHISALLNAQNPQHILEFGSGLSTVFLAEQCPHAHIYSLDHDAYYFDQTRAMLKKPSNVQLIHAPLSLCRFHGQFFSSYSPRFKQEIPMTHPMDLVLIDGPQGFIYGREMVLYLALPFINSQTQIILDDAKRPYEQANIAQWTKLWGSRLSIDYQQTENKQIAIIQIEDPHRYDPSQFKHMFWTSFCKNISLLWTHHYRPSLRAKLP